MEEDRGLVPLLLYALYGAGLCASVLPNIRMFTGKHAWRHRVAGAWHLLWLSVGIVNYAWRLPFTHLFYDMVLGVSGLAVTLSAAYDFHSHRMVDNHGASGPLARDTTVTVDEMLEHSFYQLLNLAQAAFLHAIPGVPEQPYLRLSLMCLCTAPWLWRARFPVNHFSHNYTKGQAVTVISVLYRLKKYQYLLYKHALLHALNLTTAIRGQSIVETPSFRLYWVSLNTAYVMEFFLQTLVKRGYMRQTTMLVLNQLLMVISTMAAVQVMWHFVNPCIAAASLVMNLLHRGHDFMHVLLMALAWVGFSLASVAA